MKSKWIHFLLGGALLLGAHALVAQEPPPGPPPRPNDMAPAGPMGPRMDILGFGEMHPGKVVAGAPYSAVAVTETKQTLADGNTIDRKVQTNVYRDSQGRTRRETTFSAVGPLTASGEPRSMVMIHDPVTSTAYALHADTKVAEQLPAPAGRGKRAGQLQDRFKAHMQQQIANGTLKEEDLGTQTINGVVAQGTRYTGTIPAGQEGNAKPITIVNERWYSPELQIVVKSTRSNPLLGETTYTLTNVQRAEPAASLFTVPSDYTVKPRSNNMRRRGPGGPGGAPMAPPPDDAPPPSE